MYTVSLSRTARKGLEQIPPPMYARVDAAIGALASDPRPFLCRKLAGSDLWRVRVGGYRIVYLIDDTAYTVTVSFVGPRGDAY